MKPRASFLPYARRYYVARALANRIHHRKPHGQIVRFLFTDPAAHEVSVVGSFNDWNPGATSLSHISHGRWMVRLSLRAGRYEYQFVVDGRWIHDRSATELVENPFGGINSVVRVPV